jgi:probable H4MPT-linked C1 transfer pathway protein
MVVIDVVDVLGLDIGGANTKATYIKTKDGAVKEQRTALEYFPVWKDGKEHLPQVLEKLKQKVADSTKLDGVGVTITAELSDAYMTKKEGINHVLDCVTEVFPELPTFILDSEATLLTVEDVRKDTLRVASANWAATGWMIGQLIKNCIVIDVGSTTTSIIPVIDGKVVAAGKTDIEKLGNGELVYSGSLRTNVATIVNSIRVKGRITRVSSELFAQSGDVHLLLGNIRQEDYTAETCDGRGKTRKEAAARLARVVCADGDMLSEKEIVAMAQYVYDRQIEQIASGLKQVYERTKQSLQEENVAVVTGLGRNFLARKAAEKVGFKQIIDMKELVGQGGAVVSPSFGVALMVATGLEGKTVKWKQS